MDAQASTPAVLEARSSKLTRFGLLLGLAAWAAGPWARAQGAAALEIALYPGIRVTGEVGSTYVIESKNGVEEDFWLTRGWLELTTPTAQWMDPVPTDSARRIYRAVKVTKPVVQTITNMVWIPPGTFVMGSPEGERGRFDCEGPQTRVTLTKGFWMGKCEVTQREYLAVTGNNPSCYPGLDRPMSCVTADAAIAYCALLTEQERTAERLPAGYQYRLPTEAEWEYACRAGTTTRYSFGDGLGCDDECGFCARLDSYMWWCANSGGQTRPAGQKLPNPWGLHDMHGSVWEWCGDWFSNNLPGGSVVDPSGPGSGLPRVMRGGYFRNGAGHCRSASRTGAIPSPWDDYTAFGFRVVLAPSLP